MVALFLGRNNVKLIVHIAITGDCDSLRGDVGLLVVRANRPFKSDFSALGDLDVVGVGRKGFVLMNRCTNVAGNFPVGRIYLLLVSGGKDLSRSR
jgi:hypothetical protein